jgi:hypothetical protein
VNENGATNLVTTLFDRWLHVARPLCTPEDENYDLAEDFHAYAAAGAVRLAMRVNERSA